MLSIVIADDEAGIVDLCKMLIEYPHAAVIGEAFNGLELFDKIGELHPNTVITDLSMPGMTGLELIEQAKTAYPDVNFIIMSGYTDFEYVQKALRFGVWDYLLKPLQKRELNSILEKLDQHLEDVYSRELRQEAAENDLARSLRVLRERYLRDVWQSGLPLPAPVIGENLILEFAGKKMRGMLFCADWQYTAPSMDRAALERQAGKLFSHLRDGMSGFPGCPDSASFTEGNAYAVLSLYPSPSAGDQAAALEKQLSHLLRELQNQWSGVRVVCACSELLDAGPGNIPLVFEQVRAAARQRIEERGRQILAYRPEAALSLKRRSPFTQREALRQAVLGGDEQRIREAVRADWAELRDPPPGSGCLLLEEQAACISQALRQLPGMEKLEACPVLDPQQILASGAPLPEELPDRIADMAQVLLSEYRLRLSTQENTAVSKAKQYVSQHFAEDISLNQIAKYVCLSPAYISSLFKTETGCGFIKYLQHVRVEHAKELLKNTKVRISDIAEEVGYKDLKFFNKIFLNETTVTPSEYRKYYS